MSFLLSILKKFKLFQLCFIITFFTSGILVNLVQCILYLGLRPFNKRLYRKVNWYLGAAIYEQLAFVGDYWANVNVQLYVDKDDYDRFFGKEHAYCILNHAYEVDWLLAVLITERVKLLGVNAYFKSTLMFKNCKAYIKKALQYVPVLGWAWKFSDFVILERSFEKDKDVIHNQIRELTDYPDPMWLLLFPEGTRFTPEKHMASQEFARERNLPQLKYHLQPRTRGFVTSLASMKGKVPAIYDIALTFPDDDPIKPTVTNLMRGESTTAHLYIKRIPMENIPTSEVEQEKFLRHIFVQKDRLRDSFAQTGDFFAISGVPRVMPFKAERRIYPLMVMIMWGILVLYPIVYYLFLLMFSGTLLNFAIGVGIITFFVVLSNKMLSTSKISKGSSYGVSHTTNKV